MTPPRLAYAAGYLFYARGTRCSRVPSMPDGRSSPALKWRCRADRTIFGLRSDDGTIVYRGNTDLIHVSHGSTVAGRRTGTLGDPRRTSRWCCPRAAVTRRWYDWIRTNADLWDVGCHDGRSSRD